MSSGASGFNLPVINKRYGEPAGDPDFSDLPSSVNDKKIDNS
jgi:hypothetical protein